MTGSWRGEGQGGAWGGLGALGLEESWEGVLQVVLLGAAGFLGRWIPQLQRSQLCQQLLWLQWQDQAASWRWPQAVLGRELGLQGASWFSRGQDLAVEQRLLHQPLVSGAAPPSSPCPPLWKLLGPGLSEHTCQQCCQAP